MMEKILRLIHPAISVAIVLVVVAIILAVNGVKVVSRNLSTEPRVEIDGE